MVISRWDVEIRTRIIDKEHDIRKVVLYPYTQRGRTRISTPDIFALDEIKETFKKQGISITRITKQDHSIIFILIKNRLSSETLLLSKDKSKGCLVFKVMDHEF